MAKIKISLIFFLAGLIFFCGAASQADAQCNNVNAKPASLLKLGEDDGKKIPLILVHGLQGVEDKGDTTVLDDYWNAFTEKFWKTDKTLQAKYVLYAFQYCSDRTDV
jgi:uncharacterized alpha/beta hydrolase family protein